MALLVPPPTSEVVATVKLQSQLYRDKEGRV